MGERFMEMIRFATDTLGDLKKCNLYDDGYATIEMETPDGKILTISMTVKEEETNA